MFFKYYEFTILYNNNKNIDINFKKFLITTTSHLIGLFTLILIFFTCASLVLRTAMFSLSFFFIIYWLTSIFTYLFKKSQYGIFNRIIQRFWKRALGLFWMLELSLFFIYLFLAIISPQEVPYMLDNNQLIFNVSNNLKPFFINVFYALILILTANVHLLLHKYNSLKIILNALIFLFLIRMVFDDFIQFYAINNFYNSFNWMHSRSELPKPIIKSEPYFLKTLGVWELEQAELKTRTIFHYFYLLIFLKLWHTIFIIACFIFLENASIRSNNTSFNIIAANIQNFYFLMFFNYILKISLLKAYLSYLGTFVFYWFFVNYNLYDWTYYYELFHINYLLFIFKDLINELF